MQRMFLTLVFMGCVLLLGPAVPGRGEERPPPRSLSLDEAVEAAATQSLSLQKSAIDVKIAHYAATHLWSELFPSLSAGAGVSYSTPLFTGQGFRLDQSGVGYSVSASLSLNLQTGLPSAMHLIQVAYQTELLNYEQARRQLAIQVTKTFYTLLADKNRLAFLRETLDLAEKQREKSRVAFDYGLMGELGYLQTQLSMETARLELNKAQSAYDTALTDFLLLLGLGDDPVELAGSLEIEPWEADPEALIHQYLAQRPDVQSMYKEIERLETEERRTRWNAKAPSVSLGLQWRGSGEPSGTFSDNLSGSVNLSIPLDPWIPGTKNSQAITKASAAVEKAQLDLKNTELTARSQIRSLTANLHRSWESLAIARLRAEIAQRTYTLTEQGFTQGTVEFLELETTRSKWAEARQQLMDGELAYALLLLDLYAALNLDQRSIK
ncbi:MAG: TolC family protein [Spirochaetaceae bacterium]|jgi:outer membrane protein TolC|nr:TolC family protein [Spirochaetaceae bacterium]